MGVEKCSFICGSVAENMICAVCFCDEKHLFVFQSFIFMTVVYFGPLTCSIITTTRKFFTILASVILFANPISTMQWVGTVLVFLGKSGQQM